MRGRELKRKSRLKTMDTSAIVKQFARYECRPGGLEDALNGLRLGGVRLREMRPAVFTAPVSAFMGPTLLRGACLDFPELAAWMLERIADPTPQQLVRCIIAVAYGSGRGEEQSWRAGLVKILRARGGDVNGRYMGQTALGAICARGGAGYRRQDREEGLLRAFLEMPELRLEVPPLPGRPGWAPAERVARERGHGWIADQIVEARAARERWGELRASWITAVVWASNCRAAR